MRGFVKRASGLQYTKLIEVDGILVREGHNPDIQILKEWNVTYRKMENEIAGRSVLDIGANFGMFSVRSAALGAISVVAYEPEPGAYALLLENLKRLSIPSYAANHAVGLDAGTVNLSLPQSGNSCSASTVFTARGRMTLPVNQSAFSSVLMRHKPTLIKTDCEGSELYFLDGSKLPAFVEVVCGELHRQDEDRCQKVISSFKDWIPIHKCVSYSFNRCYTFAWKRKGR